MSEPQSHELVHIAFAAQARRSPGAVALESGGEAVTYASLDASAEALAARLRALGVGPESLVGVCLERSPEMVAALLAVLKAGGAYLPLDPGYPAERLAYMLADARPAVLIAADGRRGAAAGFAGAVVAPSPPVPLSPASGRKGEHDTPEDEDRSEPGGGSPPPPTLAPSDPPQAREGSTTVPLSSSSPPLVGEGWREAPGWGASVSHDNLAYVIYTSGSTGTPKGVMVPHEALASHMAWMGRAFPLGPGDRVLQKTPFSFDASVWEVWAPLMAGATLVLAPPGAERDPARLAGIVARERVTVLQVVPTLLRALLEVGGLERCASLRRLFCGGEALHADLAERARAATGAEVVNLYGPTEVCIDATSHRFDGVSAGTTVPIGRAVDGVRAVVLDAKGEHVVGTATGELYLGGAQVARGYLGQPELTAERFVPDPFSPEPGARLYRTGDRVRRLPSGDLEFLGRLDDQVKLRGFRVELGEVEAALARLPGVAAAAAAVREYGPGDVRLLGYVVPRAGTSLTGPELRRALAAAVPEHLVPSAVVVLDALPRTPNGKTDRAALPAPPAAASEKAPPRTPTEAWLAEVWCEVLRLERVGADDHFFDLGGHSLLATQVASRIRVRLGVDVGIPQIFDTPTLSGLASHVAAAEAHVSAILADVERLTDEEAGILYLAESAAMRARALP